jgi:hypothetical protein
MLPKRGAADGAVNQRPRDQAGEPRPPQSGTAEIIAALSLRPPADAHKVAARGGGMRDIGFVLYEGVQALDIVGPFEALHEASRAAPAPAYRLLLLSLGGEPVRSETGLLLGADGALEDPKPMPDPTEDRARGASAARAKGGNTMRLQSLKLVLGGAMAAAATVAASAQDAPARISVAEFDEEGRLLYPGDIEEWVHVGSNLGLNYRDQEFNVQNPGTFGVVTMEPTAYRAFMETGKFPDGTMLHLSFHGVVRDAELSPDGFATGPVMATEIHYRDSEKFPDGFNFFTFRPGQEAAAAESLPNVCVTCHIENAAYEGVFTQFYPRMLERLGEQRSSGD